MRFKVVDLPGYEMRATVSVNQITPTWRGLAAHLLRRAALRLDPCCELRVSIDSEPGLSPAAQQQCIDQGKQAIFRSVVLELRAEAVEEAMLSARPDLRGSAR